MSVRATRFLASLCLAVSLVLLYGCSGMEFVPGGKYFFYHEPLPAAKRAIEAARKAGKDKECPEAFQAAEKLKNEAYKLYDACHTAEAIAKAKEAIAAAGALCPPKPTPTPVPVAPAISFAGAPASVEAGGCSTLTWSTSNADRVAIDQGIGAVKPSGSKEVCPAHTTVYTLSATGAGGTRWESTTVTVGPKAAPPPAAAPAPAPIDRLTLHVTFATDKADIRKADLAELEKAVAFVKKYPGCKVSVDGYTDSTGGDAYNMALSERRAASVKDFLVSHGATDAGHIASKGYGKSNPVADNKTAKGRAENRRVEVVIVSR